MAFVWSDTIIPTTGGQNFRDFVEDTGHAVLVGVGDLTGLVRNSVDGVTWVNQTPSVAIRWRALAYAPTIGVAGRLCAVASNNGLSCVMTSDNGGVTWVTRTAAEANAWQSIIWVSWLNTGSGWFVAVASSGANRIMTSPDGITWTSRPAPAGAKPWSGLKASSTTLVALSSQSGTFQVMASTDAVNWALQNTSAGSASANLSPSSGSSTLAYSPTLNMFAYVLNTGGTLSINTSVNQGATWVSRALPSAQPWVGIRWIPAPQASFLVGSQSATTFIAVSTDGIAFTETQGGPDGATNLWDCMGWMSATNTVVQWGQNSNTHMLVGHFASVDSLTPIAGTKRGGTVVILTGAGFTGVTSVTFGGTAAVSVNVASDTTIVCVTPPHAIGLVDVTVTGIGTLTNAYSFVSVDHASAPSGTVLGGRTVTVTGFGFNAATGVLFGASAATSVTLDAVTPNLKLTAVTPAHASGLVDITVSGVDIGTGLYTYTLPVPQLQGKGPLLPPIPTPRRA